MPWQASQQHWLVFILPCTLLIMLCKLLPADGGCYTTFSSIGGSASHSGTVILDDTLQWDVFNNKCLETLHCIQWDIFLPPSQLTGLGNYNSVFNTFIFEIKKNQTKFEELSAVSALLNNSHKCKIFFFCPLYFIAIISTPVLKSTLSNFFLLTYSAIVFSSSGRDPYVGTSGLSLPGSR